TDNTNFGSSDISQPDIITLRNNRSVNNNSSFNAGTSIFFNHKFRKKGRNIHVNSNVNYSKGDSYRDSENEYIITQAGTDSLRFQNQLTDNNNDNFRTWINFSYMEPIAERSFLQASYSWSRSETSSNRDTRDVENGIAVPNPDLSNIFEYQFTTNRIGLNY